MLFIVFFSVKLNAAENLKSNWKNKRASFYQQYTNSQLNLARSAFENILRNNINDDVVENLQSLNLMIHKQHDFWIINEKSKPYSGQGMYAIRITTENQLLLQAPHAYSDLMTGSLVLKMMKESKIKAISINTIGRKYKKHNGNLISADMAHISKSLFLEFSKAFGTVFNEASIIQLHGFNAKKRNPSEKYQLIISNGTPSVSLKLMYQKNCLNDVFSIQSHIYPNDVNFLGGTKNVIGQEIRHLGFDGFEHIEMSLEVRKKLNKSSKKRQAFINCLIEK